MSRTTNDVTLFSNGIGHFRRVYKVAGGKEENFSIPFKRDHIGDVAASLQVFGKVRLTKPPSFTPSNANATSLRIQQNDAYRSLLSSLSGAQVTVKFTNTVKGQYTLLGIDQQEVNYPDRNVTHDFIVLMQNGKIHRRSTVDIEDIHFDEEGVRTEIDKALKNNFQTIKPDSTLMDLCLQAVGDRRGDTEAVVQYTIPVAAWKMRYAIRQDGDSFSLEGAAIIDNNTDEDWDNFRVSVVTGNPISFSTDIANVVMPARKFVRLVDATALGNVDVAEGFPSDNAYSLQQLASGDANLDSFEAACPTAPRSLPKGSARALVVWVRRCPLPTIALSEWMPCFSRRGLHGERRGGWRGQQGGRRLLRLHEQGADHNPRPQERRGPDVHRASDQGRCRAALQGEQPRPPPVPHRQVQERDGVLARQGQDGHLQQRHLLRRVRPRSDQAGREPHAAALSGERRQDHQGSQADREPRTALRISDGVGVVEDVYTAVSTYEVENKKDEKFKVAVEHVKALGNAATVNVDFELSGASSWPSRRSCRTAPATGCTSSWPRTRR
jgi:hypothetical protein